MQCSLIQLNLPLQVDYQFARNKTFLQKIGDQIFSYAGQIQSFYQKRLIDPIVSGGAGLFGGDDVDNDVDQNNDDDIEEKVDSDNEGSSDKQEEGGFNSMPLVVGGLAAAGLGAFVLMENFVPLLTKGTVINADDSRSLKAAASQQDKEAAAVVEAIHEASEKFEDR